MCVEDERSTRVIGAPTGLITVEHTPYGLSVGDTLRDQVIVNIDNLFTVEVTFQGSHGAHNGYDIAVFAPWSHAGHPEWSMPAEQWTDWGEVNPDMLRPEDRNGG